MKYFKYIMITLLIVQAGNLYAQKKGSNFGLKNAVIVGQFDKQEDRYSVEASLTDLFNGMGVKAMPSLNLVKVGQDAASLASDSIMAIAEAKGYDTYVIINVRGYDRKFRLSTAKLTLKEALERGSLYSIYQENIVSVTFEFRVYRNGEFVGVDSIKCGNVGERDSVFKRLRSSVEKRLKKQWRKSKSARN